MSRSGVSEIQRKRAYTVAVLAGEKGGSCVCEFPRMWDISGFERAKLAALQRSKCHSVSIVADKFNFVGHAFTMHQHGSAYISRSESVLRQVTGECYAIEFVNGFYDFGNG